VTRNQTPLASYLDLTLADVFRRVRTGDSIVSGPGMLIGSYRSFPCVTPAGSSKQKRKPEGHCPSASET
jgi:hypothetical protein